MTADWPELRAALADTISPHVSELHPFWPMSGSVFGWGEVHAVMSPPGRSTDRLPGETITTLTAAVVVMAVAGDDPATPAERVDRAVQAIDAAAERAVTLGRRATVAEPWTWTGAEMLEWPPGSGLLHVAQRGTIDLVTVTAADRRP